MGYRNYWDRNWNALFCLGNRLELGDFTLTVDYFNRCGDPYGILSAVKGHTLNGSVLWAASDEWEFGCKMSYNHADGNLHFTPHDIPVPGFAQESYLIGGATASWCPADDVRIQANAGYSDGLGFALLGVKYNFDIRIF